MLEDEFERLFNHHHSSGTASCDCSHSTGAGGAPLYCHLGLPQADSSSSSRDGAAAEAGDTSLQQQQQGQQGGGDHAQAAAAQHLDGQQQQQHRLAVLIPYRDRLPHLTTLLAALRPYLDSQGRPHDAFVLEQVWCRFYYN